MTVNRLNEVENIGHQAQKITNTQLSGKGFFGSRFKTIVPILGVVILAIAASIFYLYYRSHPKKPDDDQPPKHVSQKPGQNPTPPNQPRKFVRHQAENIISTEAFFELVEEQGEFTELTETIVETVENLSDSQDNQIESEVPEEQPVQVSPPVHIPIPDYLPPELPVVNNTFTGGPPTYLPPPCPPKRKDLPEPPRRTSSKQVESQETPKEKHPEEIRTRTLKRTKTTHLNSKNLYKIVKNEKNIAEKTVKASIKLASSVSNSVSKIIPSKRSYKEVVAKNPKKEILGKLKAANKALEQLIEKLKEEPIDTSAKESRYIATFIGIINTIQLNLQSLEENNLLSELSETRKIQYEVLKEKLTLERVKNPKNIKSTLTSWNEKQEARNGFFDELYTAELQFAKDLGIFLNEGGIGKKFKQNHDFRIKYEKIHEASLKMVLEFKSVEQKKTDAEKMAKVATIFQSDMFKEYIDAVRIYFPYASSREILDQGIDLRALTLATTRLPLYPLLIETAITLTPKGVPEYIALISSLKDIRQQLEFLM